MSLLESSLVYKPFQYPWCYDAWLRQQQVHWLPEEVPLSEDVRDWHTKLSDSERNLLTQIFRFFTQSDIEVNNCYVTEYSKIFKPVEVRMMLVSFSNMETIHIAAYSHLLDTIGFPEVEYSAFLKYEQMREKYEYLQKFNTNTLWDTARTLAAFGAFTEGLQLFASFAILLNFPRFNKMKGMGQIITWSVRDETLHCNSLIRLFKVFVQENNLNEKELFVELESICKEIVALEDAFIDLAFEMGSVEGLTPDQVKLYIRYIANMRCMQLGMELVYQGVEENPLPWLDTTLNSIEFVNFFENRSTEYSKAATQGEWSDVFNDSNNS